MILIDIDPLPWAFPLLGACYASQEWVKQTAFFQACSCKALWHLWLSFKPSHHVIDPELQGHGVFGDERFTEPGSSGAM